jgi:hypothetical protein
MSLNFTEGNEHFNLNNESNFDFTQEYTIEFWMQPNLDDGSFQQVINKGQIDLAGQLAFYVNFRNGIARFGHRFSGSNSSFIEAPGVFTPNEWKHYAFTAKVENGGLTRKIMVNGSLVASQFFPGQSIPQTNNQVKVGQFTYGALSNIRFWNKSLDVTEIDKNQNTIYAPGTPNLVAQYTTFDDYGAGMIDHIGGNNGIRNGTPSFASDPCFVLFDAQPQDTFLTSLGQNVTLQVSTIGCSTDNFIYQWQKDAVDISGANTPTLVLNNIQANDLGRYRMKISACGGTFISEEAEISVLNQGKTLHFDGMDDQLRWSSPSSDTKYGIEAWVRFDEDPVMQNIIVHGDQSSNFQNLATRWLRVNKDGYLEHASFSNSSGDNPEMKVVEFPEKLVANKWYHIRGFYNTVNVHIALDGVTHSNVKPAVSTSTASDWNFGGAVEGYAPFKG